MCVAEQSFGAALVGVAYPAFAVAVAGDVALPPFDVGPASVFVAAVAFAVDVAALRLAVCDVGLATAFGARLVVFVAAASCAAAASSFVVGAVVAVPNLLSVKRFQPARLSAPKSKPIDNIETVA
ncbi:MAG: hypothetical protein ABJD13_18220 [Paracoccaceae bacterium]